MSPRTKSIYASCGFTLAELLISLAILGVIATFTIPKILVSQQNEAWNSQAKEVASIVSAASQKAFLELGKGGNTTYDDIMQFTNYTSRDTSAIVDAWYNGTTTNCSSALCYRLHNGGFLYGLGTTTTHFGGTATTNAMIFLYDPDGKVTDGTTNGLGKSVIFHVYSNGLVRTAGTRLPNTCNSNYCWTVPVPASDPPWFSWK